MSPNRLATIAYALPAVPLAALYLPLFTYVTPFYFSDRGVDLAALGWVWIAIRGIDALSDPLMGWASDRTRSRFGRRRIWLALSVPVICLATWQVFVPPAEAGLAHAALWLFVLTLGWTMAQTPYAAWGAEIADSYDARTGITAWREGMVLLGTLLATILYFAGGEGGDGLRSVAFLILVLLPLTVATATRQMPEPARPRSAAPKLAGGLRALARNGPFRQLLTAFFVNGAANALPASLLLFFVEYRIGAPDALGWLVPLYFLAAIGGIPAWLWISRRFSKHQAWRGGMVFACAVFAFVPFLDDGDVVAYAVIVFLTGLALGADMALPPAIQADVIAYDTQLTRAHRAGLFFALWQIATKTALAISSGLGFILLGWAGFAAATGNTPEALLALSLLYGAAPVALKLLAVLLLRGFPLDRMAVARL